eukprot:6479522-Amphidinium_carterae.1
MSLGLPAWCSCLPQFLRLHKNVGYAVVAEMCGDAEEDDSPCSGSDIAMWGTTLVAAEAGPYRCAANALQLLPRSRNISRTRTC